IPFPSVWGSALLELSFARALPRLHLRAQAPAVRAPFDGNRIPARSAPPSSIVFVARRRRRETRGRRVESAFRSWLAQRRGEVAMEGRRGGEYQGQV
ncbi:hypothetical protein B0H14DRAFT_2753560, partial [Mycena olivaceomarginata]